MMTTAPAEHVAARRLQALTRLGILRSLHWSALTETRRTMLASAIDACEREIEAYMGLLDSEPIEHLSLTPEHTA